MKAGIYGHDLGLIYVAKDRTVKAYLNENPEWVKDATVQVGDKVSHRSSDDSVTLPGSPSIRWHRIADVPNGCTDHAKALKDHVEGQQAIKDFNEAVVESTPREPRSADVPVGLGKTKVTTKTDSIRKAAIAQWRKADYRVCCKQAARKHRKQGHTVRPVPEVPGMFAWRAEA